MSFIGGTIIKNINKKTLIFLFVISFIVQTVSAETDFIDKGFDVTYNIINQKWLTSNDELIISASDNKIKEKSYIEFGLENLPNDGIDEATLILYVTDRSSIEKIEIIGYSADVWQGSSAGGRPPSESKSYAVKESTTRRLNSGDWLRIDVTKLIRECRDKDVNCITFCIKPASKKPSGYVKFASFEYGGAYEPELVVDYDD
ncbi:MAG: DNRLRE domain-containing protein [Methanotrichaceae archaeon]|nr:DNRLRE domain-containing protein [Methanotrichaceae archaeon]